MVNYYLSYWLVNGASGVLRVQAHKSKEAVQAAAQQLGVTGGLFKVYRRFLGGGWMYDGEFRMEGGTVWNAPPSIGGRVL